MKQNTSAHVKTASTRFAAILLAVIALVLFWGLAAAPAFAQKAKILVNHFEESGWRMVSTECIWCRGNSSGGNQIGVSTVCSQSPEGERTYDLYVRVSPALTFEIAYDSTMLVRTDGDEVIELRNANVKMRHRDNAIEHDSKVVEGRYPLTEEQLGTLASAGVSKVRIQTTEGPIDISYKKDKVSAAVNAQLSLILSTLDSAPTGSDSDF